MPEYDVKEARDNCEERVYSNDYADFIIPFNPLTVGYTGYLEDFCIQSIDGQHGVLYIPRAGIPPMSITNYGYGPIPFLYTLLESSNMSASGITQILAQPYLEIEGEGTIIGFIDTGIDYQNPLFRQENGDTKVVAIWDQTLRGGRRPFDITYGSEFTDVDINAALRTEEPLRYVPSTDESGHGTFMAGIAAGNPDTKNDFTGAAPKAQIAMVKLKPAKEYLREFYLIKEDAVAYSETDIMLGIQYLLYLGRRLNKPMTICIGVGTNLGDHTENSLLERYLLQVGSNLGFCVVAAGGNEGSKSHHYQGKIERATEFEDVEIRVGEGEKGFVVELWSEASELFSVGFISPTGEYAPKLPTKVNASERITFVLENTEIYVDYGIISVIAGSPLIFMRFVNPTPGVWRIRVFNLIRTTGIYHLWLPITGFISEETIFLRPNPDVTLTSPAFTSNAVVVSTYNHYSKGIYLDSSRGFARNHEINPDLAAPGVNIMGPGIDNNYVTRTGSCIAAAHVAGAAADLMSWGFIKGYDVNMTSANIQAYLIRGADRSAGQEYPNRQWGFGKLNLYNVFDTLRNTL